MEELIVTGEETVATTQVPLNNLENLENLDLFTVESDIVHYSQEILVQVHHRVRYFVENLLLSLEFLKINAFPGNTY